MARQRIQHFAFANLNQVGTRYCEMRELFFTEFLPESLFAFPIEATVAIEKTLPGAAVAAGIASRLIASRLKRVNFPSLTTQKISG